MRIAVIGAGSWGSALAIASSKAASVVLYSHNQLQVEWLQSKRTNPQYLPENIVFPDNIFITSKLENCIASDLIITATPLNALRQVLTQIKEFQIEIPDLFVVSKGFEADTGALPHTIIENVLPGFRRFGLLIGPSFADEVALGLPTAITLAALDLDFAIKWMKKLQHIPNFRIYAHDDVIGSEVGAAVKNIIAIAVGISDGMHLGYNAKAALITRSLNELLKLVLALGGKSDTIYGLTGIGDLILTCTGDLSRNRQVGKRLANGEKIDDIIKNLGHVAEGVLTAKEVYLTAKKLNVDMPIVACVYRILYEGVDIKNEVLNLLKRQPKTEFLREK